MNGMHPLAANWMITYRCPGKCRFCLTSSGPADVRPELSAEDKLRAVEILSSLGVRRISIMGGEPFVLRELPAIVRCAYLHGVRVNITTSGRGVPHDLSAISPGLQYLNVSLDGPEDYNDFHRGKGSYAHAVQAIRAARATGIPVRLYTVLTTQNSDRAAIDWLFGTARALDVMLIMFIFLSPTGRAADCPDLRVPEAERGHIMKHIRAAGTASGVRYKDCDPYLPEGFKLFLDTGGSVYRHAGGGVQDALGSLLARPDGGPWQLLSESERREHWREFSDQLDSPPFQESAASMAPAGMAYVPPGVFPMGAAHPVYLDGYYIDTHQVTNAQYAGFLNACGNGPEAGAPWLDVSAPHCLIELIDGRFRAKPRYECYPAIMVSWYGARAYAAWCGKRLPTEAEWEKAALGGVAGRIYPWGDEPPDDRCNWRDYAGEHAHLRPDFYHGRGPLPVGLFAPNEYGLYDLAGNVWEWCADWHVPDAYAANLCINPRGPVNGTQKVLRGGAWSFDPVNLRVAHRAHVEPSKGYAYDGFRCVLGGIERLLRQYGLAALTDG
jgi:formylglycine-generating enzyme required for sulfatase activity